MMKTLLSILFIGVGFNAYPQADKYADSYECRNGKVHFFASTPISDIEATSRSANCVLNTKTKKVYGEGKRNAFEFKRKKRQDDYDEDYIESDKSPDGVLEATIVENPDFKKDGVY